MVGRYTPRRALGEPIQSVVQRAAEPTPVVCASRLPRSAQESEALGRLGSREEKR